MKTVRLFVMGGLTAAALAIGADLALATFYFRTGTGMPPGLFIEDAERGYAMAPNFSGVVDEGKPWRIETNSRGYRDAAWTTDAGHRVMVLGDGMAVGTGLPLEEGFVAKAGQLLGSEVRFFNAGVGGYQLPQYAATLKRECQDLRPSQAAVMLWYDDGEIPVGPPSHPPMGVPVVRPGLVAEMTTLPSLREWLSGRLLHPRQLAERLVGLDRLGEGYLRRYLRSLDPKRFGPAMEATAEAGVAALAEAARGCGATLTAFVLPTLGEAYYGLREPGTQRLVAAFRRAGIEVVDLRDGLPLGTYLMLGEDGHYGAAGTDLVGRALADHFKPLLGASAMARLPSAAPSN